MKYLALAAAAVGLVVAADDPAEAFLLAQGAPQCAVKCLSEGSKAAVAVGCTLTDAACSCPGGKGGKAATDAVTKCLSTTNSCPPDQLPLVQATSDKICAAFKQMTGGSGGTHQSGDTHHSGGMAPSAASAAGAASAAKASSSPSPVKAAANVERPMAGFLALAGLAAVLV